MTRRAITADAVVAPDVRGDTVVVDDGVVVEVTSRAELTVEPSEVHEGHVIVPSFVDSHLHPLGYASLLVGTSLKEAVDLADVADRLREALVWLAPGRAVVAQRMDDTRLGGLPTRHDLDAAVAGRPVLVYRYCGHIAVANTAALDLAGIDPDTPDPPGGHLDRDPSGLPTGVLRETAVDLVGEAIEPLAPPLGDTAVLTAMRSLAATGMTRMGGMVAAAKPLWCGVGDELGTLCRLAKDLPLAVDVMVIADTVPELETAARQIGDAGGKLRFWGWKGFADGSLGGHTAALWEEFEDEPTKGTLRLVPDEAFRLARAALDLGGVAAIHAIGDRAIDETLDVYDRLIAEGCDPGRLRVEHLSVASDRAITRLAESGVVASVQPAFMGSESGWVPDRLGPDRGAYRLATMRDAGVRMIGGSDCPVEPPDPLHGIHAAVARPGWDDDQHLTAAEALELFTTSPADHFGAPPPLAAGSPADFVVVDGELGSSAASVAAVYSNGRGRELEPLPWPG